MVLSTFSVMAASFPASLSRISALPSRGKCSVHSSSHSASSSPSSKWVISSPKWSLNLAWKNPNQSCSLVILKKSNFPRKLKIFPTWQQSGRQPSSPTQMLQILSRQRFSSRSPTQTRPRGSLTTRPSEPWSYWCISDFVPGILYLTHLTPSDVKTVQVAIVFISTNLSHNRPDASSHFKELWFMLIRLSLLQAWLHPTLLDDQTIREDCLEPALKEDGIKNCISHLFQYWMSGFGTNRLEALGLPMLDRKTPEQII